MKTKYQERIIANHIEASNRTSKKSPISQPDYDSRAEAIGRFLIFGTVGIGLATLMTLYILTR